MLNYKQIFLDKSNLSKDVIDIICDYIYDLEKEDKIIKINKIIENIDYENDGNYTTIVINEVLKNTKTYHLQFCDRCGKYYRTTVINIQQNIIGFFRYSHFNSLLLDTNNNNDIVVNNYTIEYNEPVLHWANFFSNRKPCKNVSCYCDIINI
jgi:hypothetical protein